MTAELFVPQDFFFGNCCTPLFYLQILFSFFLWQPAFIKVRPRIIFLPSLPCSPISLNEPCNVTLASYSAHFNYVVGHSMCDIDRTRETFSGFWDLPFTKKLLSLKEIGLSSSARLKKKKVRRGLKKLQYYTLELYSRVFPGIKNAWLIWKCTPVPWLR